ncbi:MAG: transcriptional regulator, DeoR family [Bacillales bacterium]|jgi:DeoR/GlpR family transcriptional regulator of sugar metabolism|nr:transcriptional regulator, DeoR family [Bacillales bacterium]
MIKNSTTRMLTRIKSIYMYIQERGTVTTNEIVEEFGSTPRTIQRDLSILSEHELVISPSRGKWRASSKKII